MTKNWQQAQQTIFFGKQVLDTILLEIPVHASYRWMLVEFWHDGFWKQIEEYIPENRKELFGKVMKDIEEAKQSIYD
jgi:hypothetical protein